MTDDCVMGCFSKCLGACESMRRLGELFLQRTERVPTVVLSVISMQVRKSDLAASPSAVQCRPTVSRHTAPLAPSFTSRDRFVIGRPDLTKHHRLRSRYRPFPFQSLAVSMLAK